MFCIYPSLICRVFIHINIRRIFVFALCTNWRKERAHGRQNTAKVGWPESSTEDASHTWDKMSA